LERLFQDDLRKSYFDNLRFVSEVYYNVNYNLEIITRMDDKAIKKDSLNKRIGMIYNNIQILKKIIQNSKYTPDTKLEKRAHNIVVDQLQRVKKTIQDYFILLEKLEKRNIKEINYKEEELEDDDELEDELEDLDDEDYDPENEEDKYQEKRDKKYDKKYYKYVLDNQEDEDQDDYILEIDNNNPNHVRFIYV
jgi:hypothetical protein